MSKAAELKRLYSKGKKRKILVLFSIFIAIIVSMMVSVSLGAASPGFIDAVQVIFSKLLPFLNINPGSKITQIIILNLRLPRIILAIIAGAGLEQQCREPCGTLLSPPTSWASLQPQGSGQR
jgi:iron complex transport system permease protein